MMKKRIFQYILLFFSSALLAACSQDSAETEDEVTEYGFVTRIAGEEPSYDLTASRTYRLLTFNATNYAFNNTNTGTYSGIPGAIMTPTMLNDIDGSPVENATPEENAASSLDGVSGDRWIVCVSPGIKNEANGSIPFCPADPQSGMLLGSTTRETSLGILKLYKLSALYDIRSRLTFKVAIDPTVKDDIHSIAVSNFNIIGVGAEDETIYTFPAKRQIITPQQPRSITLTDASPEGETATVLATAAPVYVASAFYAPRDTIVKALKLTEANAVNILNSDYLQASFQISQNEQQNAVKMIFTLNRNVPELLPMHQYAYIFNVKSTTVDLILEVYSYEGISPHDWCNVDLTDKGIGDIFPKVTFKVGTWSINNWTSQPLDNPEIK